MQDEAKILYNIVSEIIQEARKEKGIGYKDFCHENDIPTTTYDNIINAKTQATFYNIAKLVRATGYNFTKFGALLDKKLPKSFWENEI